MKKLLTLLLGLLALAGCKKEDKAAPQTPAATVAGLYTLSSVTKAGQTLNLPYISGGVTTSGTISLTPVASQDAQVDLTLVVRQTGKADQQGTYPGLQLQATGSGYSLLDGGQPVGTADGTTLTATDGTLTYTAKK